MQYKILGRSTLTISRVGFGCMSLKPGQKDLQLLIDKAIETGINYFDTADLYDNGLNEINIGKALKEKRNSILIATKGGNQLREDGSGWDWNPSKEYIIKAAEQSLQRLQTDRIDLYQLHGGTIEDNIDETIEAFELLQQQGKIRYYGISSIRPNVIRAYVEKSNIVSVMMQYSLLDRRPEETCLQLLQQNNIGVLARGSVAGGLLAGKPAKPYLGYTELQVLNAANALNNAANPAANAINFALHNPAITAAIVGIHTGKQLADAVSAAGSPPFTEGFFNKIQASVASAFYQQHR